MDCFVVLIASGLLATITKQYHQIELRKIILLGGFLFLTSVIKYIEIVSWWFERGGSTRSHPEHGSETPQRG
jgi:hypothetical protein